jgi:alpha-mannosidase
MKRLIAVCGLWFAGFGLTTSSADTPQNGTFPDSLAYAVQPYYKYRPDGKPGRVVLLRFGHSSLIGDAKLEIQTATMTDTSTLSPPPAGIDSAFVLLPPGEGVKDTSQVRIVIRQAGRSITSTIHVPPMRHWTVYVYPHSHVDIGYSNTQANVEFIHKRNIDQGIKLAEATRNYPEGSRYRWNPEVMWPFERYYSSASPDEKKRLLAAVRKGENYVSMPRTSTN